MATGSRIEWTQTTWNPTTGCTRASAGCDHCYAARMTRRLELMGCAEYQGLTSVNRRGDRHFNGVVRCHDDRLDAPRRWRQPKLVFVNSMSDLFHPRVPLEFVQRVFAVMNECAQHTFQVLTKRPEIAVEFAPHLTWTSNIWMGTSVENALVLDRARTGRVTESRWAEYESNVRKCLFATACGLGLREQSYSRHCRRYWPSLPSCVCEQESAGPQVLGYC